MSASKATYASSKGSTRDADINAVMRLLSQTHKKAEANNALLTTLRDEVLALQESQEALIADLKLERGLSPLQRLINTANECLCAKDFNTADRIAAASALSSKMRTKSDKDKDFINAHWEKRSSAAYNDAKGGLRTAVHEVLGVASTIVEIPGITQWYAYSKDKHRVWPWGKSAVPPAVKVTMPKTLHKLLDFLEAGVDADDDLSGDFEDALAHVKQEFRKIDAGHDLPSVPAGLFTIRIDEILQNYSEALVQEGTNIARGEKTGKSKGKGKDAQEIDEITGSASSAGSTSATDRLQVGDRRERANPQSSKSARTPVTAPASARGQISAFFSPTPNGNGKRPSGDGPGSQKPDKRSRTIDEDEVAQLEAALASARSQRSERQAVEESQDGSQEDNRSEGSVRDEREDDDLESIFNSEGSQHAEEEAGTKAESSSEEEPRPRGAGKHRNVNASQQQTQNVVDDAEIEVRGGTASRDSQKTGDDANETPWSQKKTSGKCVDPKCMFNGPVYHICALCKTPVHNLCGKPEADGHGTVTCWPCDAKRSTSYPEQACRLSSNFTPKGPARAADQRTTRGGVGGSGTERLTSLSTEKARREAAPVKKLAGLSSAPTGNSKHSRQLLQLGGGGK